MVYLSYTSGFCTQVYYGVVLRAYAGRARVLLDDGTQVLVPLNMVTFIQARAML